MSQRNKEKKVVVIIPVKKFDKSKTRLHPFLNEAERENLSKFLIKDLILKLSAIKDILIIIVTSEIYEIKKIVKYYSVDLIYIDEKESCGVNNSISLADHYLKDKEFDSSIIIPIDLPLLKIKDIMKIINFSKKMASGICIVPSNRRDGTNILLRKPHSIINTSYDKDSFNNHIKEAQRNNKFIKIFNSKNLEIDLDTPDDIKNILKLYNYNKSTERNESMEFLIKTIKKKSEMINQ